MLKMNITAINTTIVNPIEPPLSGIIAYPEPYELAIEKPKPPLAGIIAYQD